MINNNELFFLSRENYMDIKLLYHWKKMNFDLSGHFILTSFSVKLLINVGKMWPGTEFPAEIQFYLDHCRLFLNLSWLLVTFDQDLAKECLWLVSFLWSTLLATPSSARQWVLVETLSLLRLYLQPSPGWLTQWRCPTGRWQWNLVLLSNKGCRLCQHSFLHLWHSTLDSQGKIELGDLAFGEHSDKSKECQGQRETWKSSALIFSFCSWETEDPERWKVLPDMTHGVRSEAGTKPHVPWLPAQPPPPSLPGFPSLEGYMPVLFYWHRKFPHYETPCHLQEGEPAANLPWVSSFFRLTACDINNLGSVRGVPYREQAGRNCSSLGALTHPFLSLGVFFSPIFLEEETRTCQGSRGKSLGISSPHWGPRGTPHSSLTALDIHSQGLPWNWGCQPGWVMGMPRFKKTCHLKMRIRQKHWTWGWLLTQRRVYVLSSLNVELQNKQGCGILCIHLGTLRPGVWDELFWDWEAGGGTVKGRSLGLERQVGKGKEELQVEEGAHANFCRCENAWPAQGVLWKGLQQSEETGRVQSSLLTLPITHHLYSCPHTFP